MLLISSESIPSSGLDAGDMVKVVVTVSHKGDLATRHADAYRVLLVVSYPTKYLKLNTSSLALDFEMANSIQYSSHSIEYDTAIGVITYNVSQLAKSDLVNAIMEYQLLNEVFSAQTIELGLQLFWHTLPYEMNGGRSYNLSGTQDVS